MKLITYIIAFCVILAAFLGCSRQSQRPDFGINEPMDSLFNSMFPEDQPGAVVMVLKGDTIVYSGAFGMADLEKGTRMTDSTMLNISAASKTFITVGILRLAEEGKLSLDDSLSKYFPHYPSPVFNGITIGHILSHSTGLPDERPRTQEQWEKYLSQHSSAFGYGPDYRLYARGEELTRFFETIDTLTFVPGSRFEYQEAPFLLLSHIIEQVTGKRFSSWMRTNVFDAAGLTDILYFTPEARIKNMAHGYARPKHDENNGNTVYKTSGGQWVEADYGETDFYASMVDVGIYTTGKEYMKWVHNIMDHMVINENSFNTMITPRVATPLPDVSFCLGSYITDNPYEPRKVFNTRSNGGFSSYAAVFPDLDMAYIIFANRPYWSRLETASKVDSILFSTPGFL